MPNREGHREFWEKSRDCLCKRKKICFNKPSIIIRNCACRMSHFIYLNIILMPFKIDSPYLVTRKGIMTTSAAFPWKRLMVPVMRRSYIFLLISYMEHYCVTVSMVEDFLFCHSYTKGFLQLLIFWMSRKQPGVWNISSFLMVRPSILVYLQLLLPVHPCAYYMPLVARKI